MERSQKKDNRKALATFFATVFLLLALLGSFKYYVGTEEYSVNWVRKTVASQYYFDLDEAFLQSASKEDLFGEHGVLDRYSAFYDRSALKTHVSASRGEHTAFGVSLSPAEGGAIAVVAWVAGNSPAENAGLTEGAYLYGAGEEITSVRRLSYVEISSYLSSKAGGETVCLATATGLGADESELTYLTLTKSAYVENYVYYADDAVSCRFAGSRANEPVIGQSYLPEHFPADAGYIRIREFAGGAGEQFKTALSLFSTRGKKHLVLDLRSNGGGSVDIFSSVASYLCKNARGTRFITGYAVYKDGKKEYFRSKGNYYNDYFSADSVVYVLANAGTASASEALVGALVDYGTIGYENILLEEQNGEYRTYGKGVMQTTVSNLLNGEAVKLTTAKVCWPVSGKSIHGVGIRDTDGAVALPRGEAFSFADHLFSACAL